MTDATETNFPTKFSYSKDTIAEAAKRERLGEGWYPLLITDVEKKISKLKETPSKDGNMGQNPMLVPKLRPLENPKDTKSTFGPTLMDHWTLPFANSEIPDHVPPGSWAPEMLSHRLHACFPEDDPKSGIKRVIAAPQWVKNKGLMFQGTKIKKDEEHECRLESYETVYPMADKLGKDPTPLINCYIWAEVYYEEGSDWPSLRGHSPELPRGAVRGPGMVKEAGGNGAVGRAKPSKTKKKTASKTRASKTRRK
jgi:hypothetical protein